MRKSLPITSHEHREAVTSLSSRPQIVGRLKAPIGPDSFHADSACRFGVYITAPSTYTGTYKDTYKDTYKAAP